MRGVILLGGGLDSTSLLVWLRKVNPEVELYGLHVNYGQKAFVQELASNFYFCGKYKVPLKQVVVDLRGIASSSILLGTEVGKEQEENRLEGRNIILIALAATYARTIRAYSIYVAFHEEPASAPFPDATEDALLTMQEVLDTAYFAVTPFEIKAPFKNFNRLKILRIGLALDEEILNKTFTCYEGGEEECGVCTHCKTKAQMVASLK